MIGLEVKNQDPKKENKINSVSQLSQLIVSNKFSQGKYFTGIVSVKMKQNIFTLIFIFSL